MTLAEIKKIAVQHGIKVSGMKKADLVKAIQQLEGNDPCFATGTAAECRQDECLWRADCE
ncbi:MAG: SAP domain-containing protein [Geobacter sp.]|nr:MAG: SAP domain-containing protein [Geobacter sp.]